MPEQHRRSDTSEGEKLMIERMRSSTSAVPSKVTGKLNTFKIIDAYFVKMLAEFEGVTCCCSIRYTGAQLALIVNRVPKVFVLLVGPSDRPVSLIRKREPRFSSGLYLFPVCEKWSRPHSTQPRFSQNAGPGVGRGTHRAEECLRGLVERRATFSSSNQFGSFRQIHS